MNAVTEQSSTETIYFTCFTLFCFIISAFVVIGQWRFSKEEYSLSDKTD